MTAVAPPPAASSSHVQSEGINAGGKTHANGLGEGSGPSRELPPVNGGDAPRKGRNRRGRGGKKLDDTGDGTGQDGLVQTNGGSSHGVLGESSVTRDRPPKPRQPRAARPHPSSSTGTSPTFATLSLDDGPADGQQPQNGTRRSAQRGGKRSRPKPHSSVPTSPLINGDTPLNPAAPSFLPSTPAHDEQPRRPAQPRAPGQRPGSRTKPDSAPPQPPVSKRRAAFESQGSTLTQAVSSTSDDTGKVHRPRKRRDSEGKDDLTSRLIRGLGRRPFLECPICFNSITPNQPIWSCLPQPHVDRFASGTPTPHPSDSSACYTPFHLQCIRDWAQRSLEQAPPLREADERPEWRCPGCRKARTDPVAGYRCFCGRVQNPVTSQSAPHSCEDLCSRRRAGCDHSCPLPCHPGPCPPCQVALIVPCPSHHTPLAVKCAAATSNNASMTPVCTESCGRPLSCGNPQHVCTAPCHHGSCDPCDQTEVILCYCGAETQVVKCGALKMDEKKCAEVRDGVEEHWDGRFSCARPCDRFFDCSVHPCQEKCHAHPSILLHCPTSPDLIDSCACGQTRLASLPDPPRLKCTDPIPTCSLPCPKSRVCGHQCPRQCHTGPCPPCHEEVVRPCRCGESMIVLGCQELRAMVDVGEEIMCERVCQALRNCGRHECGRLCCPLSYQAKNRKKRNPTDALLPTTSDDLHTCELVCGRLLSCGLHTCPKPDHRGACGRCLQASYDELICHCGRTIVYPPVACGTTISCPYPCARDPPPCGHPKTPHPCHESPECPPCPYLTVRPCACGKDPAVKNVRCSQDPDRVSCGQTCGALLACGYHRCERSCHRHEPATGDPTLGSGECHQTCNKPKRICKHPCTSACHAPRKCPENDPCQAIVTQTCPCGNIQQRTSCGASSANPTSRQGVGLKCNSECQVRQRNARLADALGIKDRDGPGGAKFEWPVELRQFARDNHPFVLTVEKTLRDFFHGPKQAQILPPMPPAKRAFVMGVADQYRLARELIDAEPNRSVQIRRRVDTRIPPVLLSAVSAPAPKPALGNLRSTAAVPKAWGAVPPKSSATPSGSGTTTPTTAAVMAVATHTLNAPSIGARMTSAVNLAGPAGMATGFKSSRPATPVAPVLPESGRSVGGDGGAADWEASDGE